MRFLRIFLLLLLPQFALSQKDSLGIVAGSVLDEKSKALEGATVQLISLSDTTQARSVVTDKTGSFEIQHIPFGYYRLRISYVGLQPISYDSMHFRAERFDFNMNDIVLTARKNENMEEIVIYAEKPLIQSKDGNITFNAGESALSAGSNASDLLTNVPLVSKDPSGKMTVRGKEPKILIDDKPVELNQQQLQDLLESLPGSSIEKIEVMTNPPPQYANEPGGVINIVTRKGSVGMNGRINLYGGTRGEAGINGSFNYRKQGLNFSVNGGTAYNDFDSEGWSKRNNIYTDSTNFFNTSSGSQNKNWRPSFRTSLNYDFNKFHSVNLVFQYNQNNYDNASSTAYSNINRLEQIYRLRDRNILSTGNNRNPSASFTYTVKTKKPGETIRLISNYNISYNRSTRDFYEAFLNPDQTPTGNDSTQQQLNDNKTTGYNFRLNYDLPLSRKTSFSTGAFYNYSRSDIAADAYYRSKQDNNWKNLEALTNHFLFYQHIYSLRASVKQVIAENMSITAGVSGEETKIDFDLDKQPDTSNRYWSWLPFATFNKNWKEIWNLTLSYRKTIRRPGIGELNPTIDFSDAYNIRFGNPGLSPSMSHNFDLVLGRTKKSFFLNLGLGYNDVQDIFNTIRTRISNDVTQTTWQNISGRKEFEMSTWGGYTVSRQFRVNMSASYTYNQYGEYDKTVRKFRNGGSLTSNLNGNYTWKEIYTTTGSFTFNRFANPQGTVRSSLSMNLGFQVKMMQKKLIATLNIIDPFLQQENRVVTYGTNFVLENNTLTQTRNFRLTLGYAFSKTQNRKSKKTAAAIDKISSPKKS